LPKIKEFLPDKIKHECVNNNIQTKETNILNLLKELIKINILEINKEILKKLCL
jgi:hypothetical protein